MAPSPQSEILQFRRTFTLLLLLVALPSAALSGFGVLAIINERAAVERRLQEVWRGRLEVVRRRVFDALTHLEVSDAAPGFAVRPGGGSKSWAGTRFGLEAGELHLEPADPGLATALSIATEAGTFLMVASRDGEQVRGTLIPPEVLEAWVADLSGDLALGSEQVRLSLRAAPREPESEGLVGKLVSGMQEARTAAWSPALAELALPPPLQHLKLTALSTQGDPVARASLRNRVLYGVLLGLFYAALAIGVVATARALYREALVSRLKTDFVSLVSHELRTPLTSIRMFIETLALGRVTDPRETREVLQLLARETERLSAMIDEVLDWARIESGRKVYRRTPRPVADVLEAAVQAFRAQRLDAVYDLRVEVEPGLPSVDVDQDALAGAVLNLLSNAFKYSGADKRIALRARREKAGLAIDVSDHGPGIARKDQRKIFERFVRLDNLLTRKTEGSGLGLAIARRIVEAHDGRLTVASAPGEGATFTVHLAAAQGDA